MTTVYSLISDPATQAEGTEATNPLYESSMTIEHDGVAYQLHEVKVLSTTKNGESNRLQFIPLEQNDEQLA